ncbi:MAG: GAF domain-containing protein [Chloroflexi bacterium]|nr:GAF domain-containing protein [Chloroflexota bacterium]
MNVHVPPDDGAQLQQARRTIEQQANEIARLQRELGEERLAHELRRVLTVAATAGTVAAPVTHFRLLDLIVETASQVIRAKAAALFLIDNATRELVFAVALGQKAAEVRKFRVPLGHGVAGLVAVSGQPMSIADAKRDPRQAADITERIGYAPESILCVPVFFNDQIIGVLELLDKVDAPYFSPGDMEALGLFANVAGVAIEYSGTYRNLAGLIGSVIEAFFAPGGERKGEARSLASELALGLEEEPTFRRALDLAEVVHEIAQRGDSELRACRGILESFAAYLRQRPESYGDAWMGR